MNNEIELLVPHLMEFESGYDLLCLLGKGAVLEVVSSKLSPEPKGMSKLVVTVKISEPSRPPIVIKNRHLDCIATDSCKATTETIKP